MCDGFLFSRSRHFGIRLLSLCALAIMSSVCGVRASETNWPGPKPIELAPGIVQFVSPDLAGNVDGNSIAVLTARDVVLFDATLLPDTAAAVLNELKQFTPKSVRYVVNSHWHPDHTGGNDYLAKTFPELDIVASRRTRELMEDTAGVYIKTLEFEAAQAFQEIAKELKSGKGSDGHRLSLPEREEMRSQMISGGHFLADFKATKVKLPTLVFNDAMTLHYGGRGAFSPSCVFQGTTAGDVAVYLPEEKVPTLPEICSSTPCRFAPTRIRPTGLQALKYCLDWTPRS